MSTLQWSQKLICDIMFISRLLTVMRPGRPKNFDCSWLAALSCCCCNCRTVEDCNWDAPDKLDCESFWFWRSFIARVVSSFEPRWPLTSWSNDLIAESMRLWLVCAWTKSCRFSNRSCPFGSGLLCCLDSDEQVGEDIFLLMATAFCVSVDSSPTINVGARESLLTKVTH